MQGPERLCFLASPQQKQQQFGQFSVASLHIISSADRTSQERNTQAGPTQGNVSVATLAHNMALRYTQEQAEPYSSCSHGQLL